MKRLFLLLLLTFFICLNLSAAVFFKKKKDGLPRKHLLNKANHNKGMLKKSGFEDFKMVSRRAIIEDKDLSEEAKSTYLNTIKRLEYQKNQYFFYTFAYHSPFLAEEIDLKFEILDADAVNLVDDYYIFPLKTIVLNSGGGSYTSYNYTWIIRTTKQISKKTIDKSKQPVQFIVTFPGGEQRIYQLKF